MSQVKVIKTEAPKSESKYVRPKETYSDKLNKLGNEAMEEKLIDYVRIGEGYSKYKSIDDVPLNTHIRYVTQKDGVLTFRLGGFLKKTFPDYIVLTNNKVNWSVQKYHWNLGDDSSRDTNESTSSERTPRFTTIFFKKKTEEDSLHETIDTKNEVIKDNLRLIDTRLENSEKKDKHIIELENEIIKQKQHCMKLIEIIKQRD